MQMILFINGNETTSSSSALIDRPARRAMVRKVRSIVRDSAVMLVDRPAPVVPVAPRQPAPLSDPASLEEECERWDGGLY